MTPGIFLGGGGAGSKTACLNSLGKNMNTPFFYCAIAGHYQEYVHWPEVSQTPGSGCFWTSQTDRRTTLLLDWIFLGADSVKIKVLFWVVFSPLKQGVVADWTCGPSMRGAFKKRSCSGLDLWTVHAWNFKKKDLFRIGLMDRPRVKP